MRNVFNLFSSFPFSSVFHFVLHNKVSKLLNQMVLEKKLCLQLTKMEKKLPFIYFELNCLYQRMSNVPLAYV